MCRTGGRRCPCQSSENREAWLERQRRSRANRALKNAQQAGDLQAAARAQQKLDALENGTAPPARAYTRQEPAGVPGTTTTPAQASGTLMIDPQPAPAVPAAASVQDQIRTLVRAIATEPGRWSTGGWVGLAELRDRLPHVDRADLDQALTDLNLDPDVTLSPEVNQKTLTGQDRAAAARIGGEDKHVISFGRHRKPDPVALERVRSQGVAASSDADLIAALHTPGVGDQLHQQIRAEEQRRWGQAHPPATVTTPSTPAATSTPANPVPDTAAVSALAAPTAADDLPASDRSQIAESVWDYQTTSVKRDLAQKVNDRIKDKGLAGLKRRHRYLTGKAELSSHELAELHAITKGIEAAKAGELKQPKSTARNAATSKTTRATATKKPATPSDNAPSPVSGAMSDKPIAENGWGLPYNRDINYHEDGPIGSALRAMGGDARLDVDGEPLANVLGRLATTVVTGERTAQQGVDEVKAIRDRLPQGSQARAALDYAIRRHMDVPATPVPKVPDNMPAALRKLVDDLHAIPIVRQDPDREMAPLQDLITRFAAGRTGGRRMLRELGGLANKRHESMGDVGKFEIDRAITRAIDALEELPRDDLFR